MATRVLVADALSSEGMDLLRQAQNLVVDFQPEITPKDLKGIVGEYEALLVRSRTKVTKEIIGAADRLKIIGRAGVGVDNVDVGAATKRGIIVMNTPEGNTISTAELTMAMILALSRRLTEAAGSVKAGEWKKVTGVELFGKTMGVVGFGRIGGTVARRCAAFGMRVLGYDPFVAQEGARKDEITYVSLSALIREADYITVHTPLDDKTYHMIGEKEFAQMKKGVRIINCARGGIIDEQALLEALRSGKVAGAALDVFEQEPPEGSALVKLPNVIATPHIGASTAEAQTNVSRQIAEQLLEVLAGEPARNAVNIPPLSREMLAILGPYIALAEKLGRFVGQFAEDRISRLSVTYSGEMSEHNVTPITNALLKGVLDPTLQGSVNHVSAPAIAAEQGLVVSELRSREGSDFANLIAVEAKVGRQTLSVSGTYFSKSDPRIVRINGFHVDAVPEGHMLVVTNNDRPGVIRHLSTAIAKQGINIANMTVGRNKPLGRAVTVVNLDEALDRQTLARIADSELIVEAKQVAL